MRILVTGSNGIIGKQLLIQLRENYPEAEIFVINRKATDSVNGITSIAVDLLTIDQKSADHIVGSVKADLFFHLAWGTEHKDYLSTADNNVWEKISVCLVNSFYNAGGRKFIGIGSSIEYNWTKPSPFDEFSSPLGGNKWLYGQSKLNVYDYLSTVPGISYIWCRVFFVFGPGQSKGRLVPLLINNALYGGQPLSLNLELERDYISTFEIARQILLMTVTEYCGAVNICSGRAVLLGDIVNFIEEYTGNKVSLSPVKFNDSFEITSLAGNNSLLRKWNPGYTYSLENFRTDLIRTIEAGKIIKNTN